MSKTHVGSGMKIINFPDIWLCAGYTPEMSFCSHVQKERGKTAHSNKRESLLFAEKIFLLPRRRCNTKEENQVAESCSPPLSCLDQPHTCHAPGRRTGSDEIFPLAPRLGGNSRFAKLTATPMLPVFSHPFRLLCVHPAKENGQYFQIHL